MFYSGISEKAHSEIEPGLGKSILAQRGASDVRLLERPVRQRGIPVLRDFKGGCRVITLRALILHPQQEWAWLQQQPVWVADYISHDTLLKSMPD